MNDIPILHNIRLALLPILPRRLDGPHRLLPITQVVEVLVRHHLGFDKAPLEVAVDDARGLRGERAPLDRPAADLLLAGGKVVLEAQPGEAYIIATVSFEICTCECRIGREKGAYPR